MKKQFLLLIVAFFAVTSAFAQLSPRTVTCLSNDALHPIPGQKYTYQVTVPDPTTPWDTKNYTWFVTQNEKFIEIVSGAPRLNYTTAFGAEAQTGGLLMDAGTGYADVTNTSDKVEITWKSFAYDPDKPVFVVVNVDGNNSLCTINNLKVYKIEPLHAFTLDIDNLNLDGSNHTPTAYGDDLASCVSDIQSATYDPSSPNGVLYDYGENTLYYEVVSANWYDRWKLSVDLDNLQTGQTATIDWAYKPSTLPADLSTLTWHSIASALSPNGTYTSLDLIEPQNSTNAVSSAGESIIIRVVVDHSNVYEGISDEQISLAVDGILMHATTANPTVFDQTGLGDIHTDAGGTPSACPWYDGFENDIALQTIKARPNIQTQTPSNPGPTPYLQFLPAK